MSFGLFILLDIVNRGGYYGLLEELLGGLMKVLILIIFKSGIFFFNESFQYMGFDMLLNLFLNIKVDDLYIVKQKFVLRLLEKKG